MVTDELIAPLSGLNEVIVGGILTVTPFPVMSAITTAASAPAFQSSAAARLYVVPPEEEVPFWFSKALTAVLSVVPSVSVNAVPLVISTLAVLAVRV